MTPAQQFAYLLLTVIQAVGVVALLAGLIWLLATTTGRHGR